MLKELGKKTAVTAILFLVFFSITVFVLIQYKKNSTENTNAKDTPAAKLDYVKLDPSNVPESL